MRKILSLMMLMTAFVVSTSAQNGVKLTFDKPGSATNNITVHVTDVDGNALTGVTASLESTSCTEFKTGSAAALSRATNSVLAPNAGYPNTQNAQITYTFKIEGLSSDFVYGGTAVDVYALTGGGAAQGNTGSTIREWTIDVATGATEAGLASYTNLTGCDICTVSNKDGDLFHKAWEAEGTAAEGTSTLYVKVTLTKTASLGCFAGIGAVTLKAKQYNVTVNCYNQATSELIQSNSVQASKGTVIDAPTLVGYSITGTSNATVNAEGQEINFYYTAIPTYDITYVVKDRGTTVFTSAPIKVDEGTVITELPSEYQNTTFYTYSTVNVTVDADQEIEFTATLKENAPVNFTFDTTSPLYYNLKIRGNYLVRQSDNSVKNQSASEPFNPAASWAFIGNPYAGFRVINQEAGTNYFLMYDEIRVPRHAVECTTLREGDTRTWVLETNNCSEYPGGFVLRASENTGVYLHQRTNNGLSTCSVTEWFSVHNDAGSTIIASTDEQILIDLYNSMKDMSFGEGLNEYGLDGMSTADAASVLSAAGTVIENKETGNYHATYQSLVAMEAALALNQPADGKFLRIYSVQQGGYVSSTVDETVATGYRTSFTTNKQADEVGTIWYYTDSHLLSYNTGLYSTNRMAAAVGETGHTYTFHTATNGVGKYWVKPSGANYWYGGSPTLDNWSAPQSVPNTLFTLSYVESLPVEVTSAGWATLNLPVAVEVPEGVTAYVGKIEGEMLNFSEVSGVIPANTPVILEAAAGTYDFAITDAEGTVEAGYDALVGTIAAQTCEAEEYYTLQMRDGEAGMYPYSGTTLKGFKAYMSTATAAGVRGFSFGGVQTGLSGVETSGASRAAIYDLQGRRVQQGRKGVYVVNGKKVLF
ncbi:MAG: hypothetical protein IJ722_00620 [Alloprevotella sp.]|nr:hypothetical protein [Alloprevotella sp.]